MKNQHLKKSIIIPMASVLAILAFAGEFAFRWEYIKTALADEIVPTLMTVPILFPAILGLWKLTNRKVSKSMIIGFLIYGFLTVWGHLNVVTASDPLEAGLPIVVIVIPFAILFTIYLCIQLKKTIPTGGIVALFIASFLVVACGSPDLFDASISSKSDCDKEGGYWYKGKCWSEFEDDGIANADIDQVVKDQMATIEKAKITFDGKTYPIDGFDISPEGEEILLIVNFLDKDHQLILIGKMTDFQGNKPFKVAGLYAIGDIENEEDFDKILEAQGQLSAQPLAGDLNFKVTGNLTATKSDKIIPVEVQVSEAITGAGSSTIEIKGNEAYVNGDLGTRTYAQLKNVIDNHPTVKTIVLGNISGSVNDAVNMHTGRILRAAGLTTKVLKNSSIASGGVDLFCAGKNRIVEKGAKIGIHSWCCLGELTAAEVPQDHPAHQYQLAYFTMCLGEKMGSDFYFHTLTAAPFDGVHWMSDADIQKWKVSTEFVD